MLLLLLLLLDKYEPSSREYTYLLLQQSSLLLFFPLRTHETYCIVARSFGFINIHHIIFMQLPWIVLKWQSIWRLFDAAVAAAVTRLFLYKLSFICHLLSVVDSAANYLPSLPVLLSRFIALSSHATLSVE